MKTNPQSNTRTDAESLFNVRVSILYEPGLAEEETRDCIDDQIVFGSFRIPEAERLARLLQRTALVPKGSHRAIDVSLLPCALPAPPASQPSKEKRAGV